MLSHLNEAHNLIKFFKYEHLPERLQKVSKPFWMIAEEVASLKLEDINAETVMALRKLLEAKDCMVRSVL